MKIITGMCAAGDPLFDKMANISIPTFLRSNPDFDLVFFTDRPETHKSLSRFKRLKMVSWTDYYNRFPDQIRHFDAKIEHARADVHYADHFHSALNLAIWQLALQKYAEENGYEWVLQADIDGYWVGNVMARLVAEIEDIAPNRHFFWVDAGHTCMSGQDRVTGAMSAGWILWKVDPPTYILRYIHGFNVNHQTTVHDRIEDGHYLRSVRLLYPGYQLLYPFAAKWDFSKEDALKWVPAFFHIGDGQGGMSAMKQFEKFEEWFNPEYPNEE